MNDGAVKNDRNIHKQKSVKKLKIIAFIVKK